MAVEFNGSSQYASASSTLLGNEPIDMIVYGNSDSAAATQVPLALGNGGGANGHFAMMFEGAVGGDPIKAQKGNDGGTFDDADTSTGYSTATWTVASGSFVSDTERHAYINGGSEGTDTGSETDPTPDYVSVGARRNSALSQYFDGKIAQAYILDINMDDNQHAAAGVGASPFWLVSGVKVRAWYPLNLHYANRVANGYPDLTATGSPTLSLDNPARVFFPRLGGVMTF